jgi:hypothetical protein
MYVCIYTYKYVYIYLYMYVYIYIYIYICICIYMHVYIYIYICIFVVHSDIKYEYSNILGYLHMSRTIMIYAVNKVDILGHLAMPINAPRRLNKWINSTFFLFLSFTEILLGFSRLSIYKVI